MRYQLVETRYITLYVSSIQFLYCLRHLIAHICTLYKHNKTLSEIAGQFKLMKFYKRNEKTKENYLHTNVKLYIILVIYMENEKGNGLNVHIFIYLLMKRL